MVPKVIGDLPYGECAITRIGVGRPCQKTAIYSSVQKNMLCFHSMNIWMKPPEIQKKKNILIKKVDIWLFIIQYLTLISLEIQIRTLLTFSLIYLTWIRNTFTVWNTIIWTTLHYFYLPISLFLFNWQQEYFFMVHIIKLWLLMHVF